MHFWCKSILSLLAFDRADRGKIRSRVSKSNTGIHSRKRETGLSHNFANDKGVMHSGVLEELRNKLEKGAVDRSKNRIMFAILGHVVFANYVTRGGSLDAWYKFDKSVLCMRKGNNEFKSISWTFCAQFVQQLQSAIKEQWSKLVTK